MTRVLAGLAAVVSVAAAQPAGTLRPVARFEIPRDPLAIVRPVEASKPFTVAGPYGAILGNQSGAFEAWLFPIKVLSRFGITAELADYPVPIELSPEAATVEVAPAMTTITYSHAAFTVKQRMFAARNDPAGVIVLFEIASVRPLELTFHFRPDLERMWPAPNFGIPGAEWVKAGNGGYYVFSTDNPDIGAAVAMPRTRPGVLAPYQERPKSHPVELKLSFDPKRDADLFFPLLITLADRKTDAGAQLAALNARVADLYRETADYYARFFDSRLTAETPDPEFDRALRWAAVAIEQSRVKYHGETGLVAGLYESGDSARPGFGWFFGRDTLWTTYAINAYGDFALTREGLEFLIRRQRADGKIMHEFSQTADLVDWNATSYFYAAADSTSLFVMAMDDYVRASGDTAFLTKHWDAVKHAYAFTRAHDSDGDGIYENTEGTGWVESWPPGMPHQESYLAALDQQSADAMARLAAFMKDARLADSARKQAERIRATIEAEYYDARDRFYAFSRNPSGSLDRTATIYPSVAWWSGTLALQSAGPMLSRWASAEFSTDWGTRDLSERTSFYDPISYHQGSVWPLFTGWVSLAEYRAGRVLAGYAHLMQNAGLTWTQDLGAVTELLSGEFFRPLGRSSSHQTWSSAMVLSPALRGLFGLDWDAPNHTLRLAPHLPAEWNGATLRNVPLGSARLDLEYARSGRDLVVRARSATPVTACLVPQTAPRDAPCTSAPATNRELRLPLPPVEVALPHGLPDPGSRTRQLKAVDEQVSAAQVSITFEAPGGTEYELPVRLNRDGVRVTGAGLSGGKLRLRFPTGTGYTRQGVTFAW